MGKEENGGDFDFFCRSMCCSIGGGGRSKGGGARLGREREKDPEWQRQASGPPLLKAQKVEETQTVKRIWTLRGRRRQPAMYSSIGTVQLTQREG